MTQDELARLFANRPDEGPFAADWDEWLLQLGEFTATNRTAILDALRVTAVADTAGIDAAREELRMALRGAVTDLPQPTLGKAGGVNRGAVIDAIDRVFAAALRTPKPEGEPE